MYILPAIHLHIFEQHQLFSIRCYFVLQ